MKSLRIALLAVAAILSACESSTSMEIDEGSELDIERMSDPEAAAEAELRSSSKFDAQFREAASDFGVPMAVLKSIAFSQSRYEMVVGSEEFEGRSPGFGLMGLTEAQIAQAVAITGATVEEVKTDALQNVRAAAALLNVAANEIGVNRAEVRAWAPAIAKMSGIEDADARVAFVRDEVFENMRLGVGQPTEELKAAGQSLELASEYAGLNQELSVAPDYPKAVWRPSPNYNSRPSGYKPTMVVIHTCEGAYSGCWGWLANPAAGASAHYVVNSNGSEISQQVRESNRAWHVGASYNCNLNGGVDCGRNGVSVNHFSVGIEHAGYASQSSFPSGQINASAALTCDITKAHGIVRDRFHIVGHGKLQPYNRTDPGANWPWSSYLAKVSEYCGAPAPTPTPTGSLIIDSNNSNNDKAKGYVQVSSNWVSTAATAGYYGTGYWYAPAAPVSDGATFWIYMPAAGTRTIDAWWTAGTNRSVKAPFVVFNAAGTKIATAHVNQQINGKKWNAIGTFAFTQGWNKVVLSRWTGEDNKVVIADAIRVR